MRLAEVHATSTHTVMSRLLLVLNAAAATAHYSLCSNSFQATANVLTLTAYYWHSAYRYFDWSCVVEEKLDPSRRYMFAELPHGIMPLGALLSVSVVHHAFPGIEHISGVAADIVLRVPLIR
jgi:Diacylglycerol acyltransferase